MSIKKKKKDIIVSKKSRETENEKNKIPLRITSAMKKSMYYGITPAMKKSMYYDPDGHWAIINRVLRPQKK